MPITYEVKLGGELVYAKATGALTDSDLIHFYRSLRDDERVCPGGKTLGDLRMMNDVDGVTADGLRALAEFGAANPDFFEGRRAALVVNRELTEAKMQTLAAVFILKKAPTETMIVRHLDDACEWLGIDPKVL